MHAVGAAGFEPAISKRLLIRRATPAAHTPRALAPWECSYFIHFQSAAVFPAVLHIVVINQSLHKKDPPVSFFERPAGRFRFVWIFRYTEL